MTRPPVVDDHHVAELRAGAAAAAHRPAVENDAAPEPGADGEDDHVGHSPPGADLPLGDAGRVRVIVDSDRQPHCIMHVVAEGDVRERDVDGRDGVQHAPIG